MFPAHSVSVIDVSAESRGAPVLAFASVGRRQPSADPGRCTGRTWAP